MRTSETCGRYSQAEGVVQRVDTVNRELTILHGGGTHVIDVPPECPIVLRKERVKLRMVQPRDRLRVTYTEERGLKIACVVEVGTHLSPP